MLDIRKDMGNKKTKITNEDIMINIIQNKQDVKNIEHLWND
jgi:hypothetical protein